MSEILFINKVQTPDMINVEIKKVFDEKSLEWQGKKSFFKNCLIEWEGKNYYGKFTPKYYPIAIEGNKVMGIRKVMNGSPFFEWYSGGDGQTPNPGLESKKEFNTPIEPPLPVSEVYNETPPKNLVGRGASFNLAFQYCLANKVANKQDNFPGGAVEFTKESFEDFMDRVKLTAEKILSYQDKFVNH